MRYLKKIHLDTFHFLVKHVFPKLGKDYKRLSLIITNTNHYHLSESFITSLVHAEDKRYYHHIGIDPIAVVRSLWSILGKQKLQGASTIEQQLVRTITRRHEITLSRKLREVFLASGISGSYQKDVIARAYLAVAYFGWRMNGIRQACKRLSVDLQTASPPQAAQIIARLKYPEPREVSTKREQQIRNRVAHILRIQNILSLYDTR